MTPSKSYFASDPRRGQAGLFIVFNLTILFGVLGLAVDLGMAYFTRQQAQAAADAAAMAAATYATNGGPITCGANGAICGSDTTCAYPNVSPATNDLQSGCLYAAANGFVNSGIQSVKLSANTTAPPGVTGNSPSYWVKATVSARPNTLFGRFGGLNQFTINAAATAGVAYYAAGACLYVLDPTASSAFTAAGSTSLTATCGIFVNSNSASAVNLSGSASVTSTQILINGSYSRSNNASISPTPTTHAGTQADPLASFEMPTFSNHCDYTNYSVSSGTAVTMSPGVYCGGITITGGTVTANSGLYILNGSGLSISGSSSLSGTGVTFFNTGQYSGHSIGPITVSGGAVTNLSAPNSGDYRGMLFVQDRNLTYTSNNNFSGSAGSTLTGSLYFPTTGVTYAGTTTTGSYTALVAKTVTMTGTSNFKNDPSGFYTGLGTTIRGLIQ
jgi:hypothetical protein